jgi:outer membrane protein OmpA-like peptidoglycan-associated protein
MLVTALAVVAVGALGFVGFAVMGGSDDAGSADADIVADGALVRQGDGEATDGAADQTAAPEVPTSDVPSADDAPASGTDAADATNDESATPSDTATDAPDASPEAPGAPDPVADAAATASTADTADESPIDAEADTASDPVIEPEQEPAADTTAPAADTTEPTVDPVEPASDASAAESRAVVRGGQIFLEGAVPSVEAGAEIEALAAEVLGAENVFNDYVVDPAAGDPNLGNVTVEDTINFQTDSAVILSESEGLLNQGLALLTIRPSMTITIVGHTDDRGSEVTNLVLSQERADAVKQWFVDRGVDGDRLSTVGAGESEPIADNGTVEGRRLNRRIQFFLENILGDA